MCALVVLFLILSGLWGFTGGVQTAIRPAESIPQVESPQLVSCKGQPLEQDIREMLALVGNTFAGDEWTVELRSGELRTTGTWTAETFGALAYFDYLQYDCGVTQTQIDDYFSDANFEVILGNYQSHQQTAFCETDGVRLYEFDVRSMVGVEYKIRYWVWQATPTRVAALHLTFPLTQQAALAEYSGDLFPDLPTCIPAAG